MGKTIHKLILDITDEQKITVQKNTVFLDVQFQNEKLCVWYIIDTDESEVVFSVAIIGTGNPYWCDGYTYIGTALRHFFAWHIFIKKE